MNYLQDANGNEESDEAAIRRARAHSNRSIAKRNLLGVGDSLGEDYVGVIGDGTFVSSRAMYLRLFKEGFDHPKQSMTYARTPEMVKVAADQSLAAENGTWTATLPSGVVAFTGTYAAMWRRTPESWKIRSEIFVTLQSLAVLCWHAHRWCGDAGMPRRLLREVRFGASES